MLSSHSTEPGQAIKPAQTRQRAELEFVTAAAAATGRLVCSEKLRARYEHADEDFLSETSIR